MMENFKAKMMSYWFGELDIKPLFYIIDKGLCRVMAVKKHDTYEYFGVWIQSGKKFVDGKEQSNWPYKVYAASITRSHLHEYLTNYDITELQEQAFNFLEDVKYKRQLDKEEMQLLNSNSDYHY
jgi:hypothetical protein